jgi:hypothetical protein
MYSVLYVSEATRGRPHALRADDSDVVSMPVTGVVKNKRFIFTTMHLQSLAREAHTIASSAADLRCCRNLNLLQEAVQLCMWKTR